MATKKLEYYLTLAYRSLVEVDEYTDGSKCYRALCPELTGCVSHGDSPDEARAGLEEAKALYIETLLSNGQEIPRPTTTKTTFTSLMGNADITRLIFQKAQAKNIVDGEQVQNWTLAPTI